MSLVRAIALLGMLTVMPRVGLSDILPGRNPLPRPPVVAPVKIEVSEDPDGMARIVIPKSLLPEFVRQSNAGITASPIPAAGPIIAGLALSGAAISLMFVLRNSPRRKVGLACLIGCVALVAVVVLMDDTFRFGKTPGERSAGQSKPQSLIEIVIQDNGHEVTLQVPQSR